MRLPRQLIITVNLALILAAIIYATSLNAQPDTTFIDSGQHLGTSFSSDVALGDLNNDGYLDAVVANLGGSTAAANEIWRGSADGTFTFARSISGPTIAYAVKLADFNNDDQLDIYFANGSSDQIHLMGDSFSTLAQTISIGNNASVDVALGDLDADGDIDAVTANGVLGKTNNVWLNQGGAQAGDLGPLHWDHKPWETLWQAASLLATLTATPI